MLTFTHNRLLTTIKTYYLDILVFKTNVRSRRRVNDLASHLEKLEGILKWNVDLQDVDKVLRVESASVSARAIEHKLQQAGYFCEELTG